MTSIFKSRLKTIKSLLKYNELIDIKSKLLKTQELIQKNANQLNILNNDFLKNEIQTIKIGVQDMVSSDQQSDQNQNNTQFKSLENNKYLRCLSTNCDSVTNSVSHIKSHTNLKPFKCDFNGCEQTFRSRSKMKEHVDGVHLAKFVCHRCHKQLATKRTLYFHQITFHLDEVNYSLRCNRMNCSKCLSYNSSLKKHYSTHSSVKPFKCDFNGCERTFRYKTKLEEHKDGVHLAKFVCKPCNKQFTTKRTLDFHNILHMNEDKYKYSFRCRYNDCSKRFCTKSSLKRHYSNHSSLKSIECDFKDCEKTSQK